MIVRLHSRQEHGVALACVNETPTGDLHGGGAPDIESESGDVLVRSKHRSGGLRKLEHADEDGSGRKRRNAALDDAARLALGDESRNRVGDHAGGSRSDQRHKKDPPAHLERSAGGQHDPEQQPRDQ